MKPVSVSSKNTASACLVSVRLARLSAGLWFKLVLLTVGLGLSMDSLWAKNKKPQVATNAKQAKTKATKSEVQAVPDQASVKSVSSGANNSTGTGGTNGASGAGNSVNNGDTVLLSMDGKPVLTVQQFDEFLAELASTDPQIGFMLQYDPARVKEGLFENKVQLMIIGEWAKTTGVRETAKYREEEQKRLEALRMQLDVQSFIQDHKVEVTDADIKEYYEKNKATNRSLLLSPAGITAQGVRFEKDQQAQAEALAQKLKTQPKAKLTELAKASDLEVSNLGIINDDSVNVMPEIKTAILAVKQFPHVAVVKCEDDYWVIEATGKVAAQYRPLEQVKEGLREYLLPEKTKQMLETELPKLAQKFKLVENKQYFEDLKQKQAAKMAQEEELVDLAADLSTEGLDNGDELDSGELLDDIELDVQG